MDGCFFIWPAVHAKIFVDDTSPAAIVTLHTTETCMTIAAHAFATRQPIPIDVQDQMRREMAKQARSIGAHPKKIRGVTPGGLEKLIAMQRTKGDETFNRLWPQIEPLLDAGMNKADIGRQLDTPVGTIRNVIQRAGRL